jgi:hypothetical protein
MLLYEVASAASVSVTSVAVGVAGNVTPGGG